MIKNFEIYNGDCLKEADKISTSSVDLILTDLPYGIMKGIDRYNRVFKSGNYDWDEALDTDEIFKIASRILKKECKNAAFFSTTFYNKVTCKTA